jgi:dTMP kinase
MTGWFFTFEGIDGSGKTTVSRSLYQSLQGQHDVVWTKEPTDTWLGDAVEHAVAEQRDPATIAFLFMADRVEHSIQIREWLASNKVVLCDRYLDSTIAYQAVELKNIDEPVQWLRDLHHSFSCTPDLTFLFILDPKEALRRIDDRALSPYEHRTFLEQVQENYRRLAREEDRFVILDATRSPDMLVEKCKEKIREKMAASSHRF